MPLEHTGAKGYAKLRRVGMGRSFEISPNGQQGEFNERLVMNSDQYYQQDLLEANQKLERSVRRLQLSLVVLVVSTLISIGIRLCRL